MLITFGLACMGQRETELSEKNKFAVCFLKNNVEADARLDSICQLINFIRKDGYVGIAMESDQFWRFVLLLRRATNPELVMLSKDVSPAIRIYALIGLYYTGRGGKRSVIRSLKDDKATVSVLFLDAKEEYTVAKFADKVGSFFWKEYMEEALRILDDRHARDLIYHRVTSESN